MTVPFIPQCYSCRHKIKGHLSCAAFDRIPGEILRLEFDHTEPYPGDNGIRYEPISPQK